MNEIRKNKRKILDIKAYSSMIKMIICFAIFCIMFLFNTDSVFALGNNIGTAAITFLSRCLVITSQGR